MFPTWIIRYEYKKRRDFFWRWLVWKLPRRMVMWAYYRVVAYATTGEYGNTIPNELDVMEAVNRWGV
jgi:hypothetical protein